MSNRIGFSVTNAQMEVIRLAAATKGLSESQLAKMALFAHINQHPPKGVMSHLAAKRSTERPSDDSEGDVRRVGDAE